VMLPDRQIDDCFNYSKRMRGHKKTIEDRLFGPFLLACDALVEQIECAGIQ